MNGMMTVSVHGEPAPQGSKRYVGNGVMIESSKKVKPWREAVLWAVLQNHPFSGRSDPILIRGPVAVDITFVLPRPKSARKNTFPDKKPDLDKLLRSTFDALKSAGVFEDDARVVDCSATKVYGEIPGAQIRVMVAL